MIRVYLNLKTFSVELLKRFQMVGSQSILILQSHFLKQGVEWLLKTLEVERHKVHKTTFSLVDNWPLFFNVKVKIGGIEGRLVGQSVVSTQWLDWC